jgi:hypothetical protein
MNWKTILLTVAIGVAAALATSCSHPDDATQISAPTKTCGPRTPIFSCPGDPIVSFTPTTAPYTSPEGLVTARHDSCDFGPELLHYLETGDNDGNPWYDQHYAADVGVPLPQARAIADAAIERCDDTLDAQEAQTSRAASQSAAATTSAARQAALAEKEAAACGQIGGVLTQRAGGDTCRSATPDAPGNDTTHTRCYLGNINFNPDGSLIEEQLEFARRQYPKCYTF